MAADDRTAADADHSDGDPFQAFGYVVAGVLLYGGIGWGLDRWLGTPFLVVVGILLGAGLGLYQTFARFGFRDPVGAASPPRPDPTEAPQTKQSE